MTRTDRRPGIDDRQQARGWIVILAAFGASATGSMLPFLTGALAPQIQADLGIGDAAFGAAVSVVFATGGLGVMPAGALVDRVGWRLGIQSAAVFGFFAILGIGLLSRSYSLLIGFLFLGGIAQAQAGPAGSLAIVERVPSERRGTAFGMKQTAAPAMATLSGLAIPTVAMTIGWRWAYVFMATIPVATYVLARRASRGSPTLAIGPGAGLRGALRAKSMGFFTVASAFGMASVGALTGFIVLAAVDDGLTPAQAGLLITIASLVGLGARIAAGVTADRLGVGGFPVAGTLLAVGSLGFATLAVGRPAAIILGTLVAYAGGWGWTGLMQYGAVAAHPESPASAASIVQAGMSLGGAIGPVGYGVLASRVGYSTAWIVVALSTATAAVLILVGLLRLRGVQGRPSPSGG